MSSNTTPVELNVAAIHAAITARHPERDCIAFRDRRFTWAATAERTDRLANVLRDAGLGIVDTFGSVPRWESVHDSVALYLHNGNEYLEGMLGAWKARTAPFNVNYRYVAEELQYLLDDAHTRAVIVHECFAPVLAEVLPKLAAPPVLILQVADGSGHGLMKGAVDYEAALATAAPELPETLPNSWSGDDLYLCYTGGTTGRPKGAMWRQADFLVSALGVSHKDGTEYASLDELVARASGTARTLPAPPLMHGAAHWSAISAWCNGGAVVIQDHPEHFAADDVIDSALRHGANALTIVGDPMARPLVDALRARPAGSVRLNRIVSGGAVLSPAVKAELLELLPGTTIVDILGSTESGRQAIATTWSDAPGGSGATAFVPDPTTTVLADDLTRRLAPDEAEVGWLARTGRVPLGYLGDAAKTNATIPEVAGFRYVVAGDRARWRADGTIELLGRDSVCINTGGEKVFAEEVETALKLHPAVFDAVVCGRASRRWGQVIVAIVQPRPGATIDDDELRAEAGKHLARYKLPKHVVHLERIVRSPSGKADYPWARSIAEAQTPDD